MTITEEELNILELLADKAQGGEWCESFCYSAIRHVCRNCDIECAKHHKTDTEEECNYFGRYDGPYIAYANPSRIKRLIESLRERSKK